MKDIKDIQTFEKECGQQLTLTKTSIEFRLDQDIKDNDSKIKS